MQPRGRCTCTRLWVTRISGCQKIGKILKNTHQSSYCTLAIFPLSTPSRYWFIGLSPTTRSIVPRASWAASLTRGVVSSNFCGCVWGEVKSISSSSWRVLPVTCKVQSKPNDCVLSCNSSYRGIIISNNKGGGLCGLTSTEYTCTCMWTWRTIWIVIRTFNW